MPYFLLEKLTNIAIEEKPVDEKKVELSFILFIVLIKFALIYFVSAFLWPRVMPEIFKNVKSNPSFTTLVGLSVLINLLL